MESDSLWRWQRAENALSNRQTKLAVAEYTALLDDPDWVLPARLRLGEQALRAGRLREATAHALDAHAHREPDAVLLEAVARLLLHVGELRAALDCLDDPAVRQSDDPEGLLATGSLLADQGLPERALPLLQRARSRGADTPLLDYQIGNALRYTDDSTGARTALEACLRRAPDFGPAHRSLAKLRKATPDDNAVARLRASAARLGEHAPDAPQVNYALFKELDDLGDAAGAWQALEAGMRQRRRQLDYDDAIDAAVFDGLMQLGPGEPVPAADGPVPVFILGLPRSGTTLLERILGGHPDVTDAGELRDFTAQLRWCTQVLGSQQHDPALVAAAAGIDFEELGRRYLAHTQWQAKGRALYTDKLPANFLNAGYICRALPQARLIHLVREPMDVCFSNLKELFGDAYPYSYDQADMAAHYARYRRLMDHWRATFPGRILDVDYAQLVTDPEPVARAVYAHCGLDWRPEALAIENRRDAVATASAAQVREPIHARFLGQWRRYEAQLQPLRAALGPLAG